MRTYVIMRTSIDKLSQIEIIPYLVTFNRKFAYKEANRLSNLHPKRMYWATSVKNTMDKEEEND